MVQTCKTGGSPAPVSVVKLNPVKTILRGAIRGYQIALSPLIHALGGAGCGCRFQPTCSNYCLQALEMHGVVNGVFLGMRRIARCQPWGGAGTDPVPETTQSGLSRTPALTNCGGASKDRNTSL